MEEALRQLVRIQKLDLDMDATERELEQIPVDLHDQDREIEALGRELASVEQRLDDVIDDQKEVASRKEESRKNLAEYKTRLTALKTNQEYRAMLSQIEYAEQTIDDLDSRAIELMYAEDEARSQLEDARRKHDRVVERALRRKSLLEERASGLESQLSELREARAEIASSASTRFVRKYEQLRKAGKGEAVVGLMNGNCGGCLTVVPPQNAVEIKNGEVYNCPICGRFIVWTDDSSFARKD